MEREEIDEEFFKICFEELSESDQSSDETNKENSEPAHHGASVKRQPNTKAIQMQKIAASVLEIPEDASKEDVISHWNKLTIALNEMGPPEHSRADWRRVWSMHKTNRKRKQSTTPSGSVPKRLQCVQFSDNSSNHQQDIQSEADISQSTQANISVDHGSSVDPHALKSGVDHIADKLDLLLEKQDTIITLLTTMCTLMRSGSDCVGK